MAISTPEVKRGAIVRTCTMAFTRIALLPTSLFVITALAVGCKTAPDKSTATTTQADGTITTTTSTAATAAPPASVHGMTPLPAPPPGATVAAMANEPMGERFGAEARARPDGAVKAEAVFAAINDAGLVVTEQKQHLASPFGARYCVGAKIADASKTPQMDASVCEYADANAAAVGRDRSLEGFKVVPNRTVTLSKLTTITIREYTKSDANDALVAKVQGIFTKM